MSNEVQDTYEYHYHIIQDENSLKKFCYYEGDHKTEEKIKHEIRMRKRSKEKQSASIKQP